MKTDTSQQSLFAFLPQKGVSDEKVLVSIELPRHIYSHALLSSGGVEEGIPRYLTNLIRLDQQNMSAAVVRSAEHVRDVAEVISDLEERGVRAVYHRHDEEQEQGLLLPMYSLPDHRVAIEPIVEFCEATLIQRGAAAVGAGAKLFVVAIPNGDAHTAAEVKQLGQSTLYSMSPVYVKDLAEQAHFWTQEV